MTPATKTMYDLVLENYTKHESLVSSKTFWVLWFQMPKMPPDSVGVVLAFPSGESEPCVCRFCHKTQAISIAAWLLKWEPLNIPVKWDSEGQALKEELDIAEGKLRENAFSFHEDISSDNDDARYLWRTPSAIWVCRESPCYQEVIDSVKNYFSQD